MVNNFSDFQDYCSRSLVEINCIRSKQENILKHSNNNNNKLKGCESLIQARINAVEYNYEKLRRDLSSIDNESVKIISQIFNSFMSIVEEKGSEKIVHKESKNSQIEIGVSPENELTIVEEKGPSKKDIQILHETIGDALIKSKKFTKKIRDGNLENTIRINSVEFDSNNLSILLKPGDILLKYHKENSDGLELFNFVDFFIRNLHSFAKLYTKTSTSFSNNLVHAAIYTGDGNVSEAIATGVRLNHLNHERIALKPGMTCGYIVVRPKNHEIAQQAGKIAESLSAAPEEDVLHSYSIPKGIRGSVSSSELQKGGLESYLKAAAYAFDSSNPPMEGTSRKKFYCSHFVMWCLQAAEGNKIIQEINEKLPESDRIKMPNVDGLSDKKTAKVINKWAKNTARMYSGFLISKIELNLNPSKVTPQRLFGFVIENPELFECKMVITPPKKNDEEIHLF